MRIPIIIKQFADYALLALNPTKGKKKDGAVVAIAALAAVVPLLATGRYATATGLLFIAAGLALARTGNNSQTFDEQVPLRGTSSFRISNYTPFVQAIGAGLGTTGLGQIAEQLGHYDPSTFVIGMFIRDFGILLGCAGIGGVAMRQLNRMDRSPTP
jgi:hypothetical protein